MGQTKNKGAGSFGSGSGGGFASVSSPSTTTTTTSSPSSYRPSDSGSGYGANTGYRGGFSLFGAAPRNDEPAESSVPTSTPRPGGFLKETRSLGTELFGGRSASERGVSGIGDVGGENRVSTSRMAGEAMRMFDQAFNDSMAPGQQGEEQGYGTGGMAPAPKERRSQYQAGSNAPFGGQLIK